MNLVNLWSSHSLQHVAAQIPSLLSVSAFIHTASDLDSNVGTAPSSQLSAERGLWEETEMSQVVEFLALPCGALIEFLVPVFTRAIVGIRRVKD